MRFAQNTHQPTHDIPEPIAHPAQKTAMSYSRFFAILSFVVVAILFASALVQEAARYSIYLGTLILLLAGLFALCYRFMKQQDELHSLARFQTALFSAAARNQSAFYLIIRDGRRIEYADREFQKLFPEATSKITEGIENVFECLQLPQEASHTLSYAMQNHKNAYVQEQLKGDTVERYVLTYEALSRPNDYGVLRGRLYVERKPKATTKESSTESKPHTLEILSELPLEPFIANSPLAAACLDLNGQVTSSNPSFRDLTETTDRAAGWRFHDVISKDDQELLSSTLDAVSNLGDHETPLDVNLATQKERSALVYFSRFEQKDSSPQILVHLIDTTEQKNLEVKYAHSQKMQAVGQLAGGVAHDFNNLLTAMIGFCDLLLQRHPAGDQSFADIMQIKQNANRAANLVRQLLAFSRRQTLQPKMLQITDVLAELSNLVRRLIGESIDLKVSHGRDMGYVKADQGQLEQVLINLAVNARDAMNEGGMLTVSTKVVDITKPSDIDKRLIAPQEDEPIVPGNYVLVKISDTGHGIPKDKIQKIFEPFYSTKEVGAGTGLGLATVYGIIKQTGGYIYVESEEGQGTTFHLFFPRFAVSEETEKPSPAETDNPKDLTGTGTILLVEDEEPVRNFAARALRNKGYTVLEADCGEMALEVIEEHREELEVIVSDVIMPGMNGPEMIQKILPDHPDVKIIFISGYAEDAFTDSFSENVKFHFLPKPFTLKQLAAKIKEVHQS